MRRRAVIITITMAVFSAVMWLFGSGGVARATRSGQPFALLAAAPEIARADTAVALPDLPSGGAATDKPSALPLTVLTEGAPSRNEIALTFDDGPHPGYTEKLLKILGDRHVKATFFLVGKMVEVAGDLVQREVAEGHEVGNHTYSHVCLKTATVEQADLELRKCNAVVETLTGKRMDICRPPGGVFNREAVQIVKQLGMMTVLWTCDPADYEDLPAGEILSRTVPNLSPGGIVLLHDGIQGTVDALPQIITACEHRGFKFVTCTEMANHKAR
jgi:peptidoglycan/xylan/chitin deacetylase (PgdA/CDA1 family)